MTVPRGFAVSARPGGVARGYFFFHGIEILLGPKRMLRLRVMYTGDLGCQISPVLRTPVSPNIRIE